MSFGLHKGMLDQSRPEYKNRNKFQNVQDDTNSETEMYTMFMTQGKEKPHVAHKSLDGVLTEMEVDTGASLSVTSDETLASVRKCPCFQPRKSTKKLMTYTREEILALGVCAFSVFYNNVEPRKLDIVVVKGKGLCFVMKRLVEKIQLDWSEIFLLKTSTAEDAELAQTLSEVSEVFEDTRGTVRGRTGTIFVDPSAKAPLFQAKTCALCASREGQPRAIQVRGKKAIEQVQFSDWAAPIVTVVKPDKSIRICGDYKVTVNIVSKLDNYSIPKADVLLADLVDGKYLTELDMTQVHQQLVAELLSKQNTTIKHK